MAEKALSPRFHQVEPLSRQSLQHAPAAKSEGMSRCNWGERVPQINCTLNCSRKKTAASAAHRAEM